MNEREQFDAWWPERLVDEELPAKTIAWAAWQARAGAIAPPREPTPEMIAAACKASNNFDWNVPAYDYDKWPIVFWLAMYDAAPIAQPAEPACYSGYPRHSWSPGYTGQEICLTCKLTRPIAEPVAQPVAWMYEDRQQPTPAVVVTAARRWKIGSFEECWTETALYAAPVDRPQEQNHD